MALKKDFLSGMNIELNTFSSLCVCVNCFVRAFFCYFGAEVKV
jgi:hypothetical protein